MAKAWDKNKVREGIPAPDLNDEIRENWDALETALNKEMNFSTGGVESLQGIFKQGGARPFFQDTAPATRVDGSAFAATDLGLFWIDSNSSPVNQFNILTATTPTWTPVSTEVIAVLLASARTFAEVVRFNEVVTFDKAPVFSAGGGVVPIGTITAFGGSSAPTGWLICGGSEVSQTTYAALYAVLGVDAFGTDAGGNFFLPDLRGRTVLGVGTGDASDATAHALGEKEGTESHTLSESEMPAHTHTVSGTDAGTGSARFDTSSDSEETTPSTNSTGGGTAHNNLQPSLTLNYIIKI